MAFDASMHNEYHLHLATLWANESFSSWMPHCICISLIDSDWTWFIKGSISSVQVCTADCKTITLIFTLQLQIRTLQVGCNDPGVWWLSIIPLIYENVPYAPIAHCSYTGAAFHLKHRRKSCLRIENYFRGGAIATASTLCLSASRWARVRALMLLPASLFRDPLGAPWNPNHRSWRLRRFVVTWCCDRALWGRWLLLRNIKSRVELPYNGGLL